MMEAVTAFSFRNRLRQLTKEQVALQENFAQYAAHQPLDDQFGPHMAKALAQAVHVPCQFSSAKIQTIRTSELKKLLPEQSCYVWIGTAPDEQKILVDIEPVLALHTIERTLGTDTPTAALRRPLTAIEQGILSYALLKILKQFHQSQNEAQQLVLTLNGFAAARDDVLGELATNAHCYMLSLTMQIGEIKGYSRIFIPHAILNRHPLAPIEQHNPAPAQIPYIRKILGSLGTSYIPARVELGTLGISDEQILDLETGDIVLLEPHEVQMTPLGPQGSVIIRLGTAQHGMLRARLLSEGGHMRVEILDMMIQEEPMSEEINEENTAIEQVTETGTVPESKPELDDEVSEITDETEASTEAEEEPAVQEVAADHETEAVDNLEQTAGLLRDAPAPVAVELGRIQLNTLQVANLHAGQILRLPRGFDAPVDLVVHGKIFAQGELVEIEGELGVRLLSLHGAATHD